MCVLIDFSVYAGLDNNQLNSSKYKNIRILIVNTIYILILLLEINYYFFSRRILFQIVFEKVCILFSCFRR
jgi:hypothetical protein